MYCSNVFCIPQLIQFVRNKRFAILWWDIIQARKREVKCTPTDFASKETIWAIKKKFDFFCCCCFSYKHRERNNLSLQNQKIFLILFRYFPYFPCFFFSFNSFFFIPSLRYYFFSLAKLLYFFSIFFSFLFHFIFLI